MSTALDRTLAWCSQHGLSIHPSKTVVVPFHRKKNRIIPPIIMSGTELAYSEEVTYLGLKLDRKLTWKPHLQWAISKARKSMWACRNLVGRNWGLNPKMVKFIYTTMIRPIVTYGSVVWWSVNNTQTAINLCTKLQRSACLLITGSGPTCPTIPIQALVGLKPLHLHILSVAAKTAVRFD